MRNIHSVEGWDVTFSSIAMRGDFVNFKTVCMRAYIYRGECMFSFMSACVSKKIHIAQHFPSLNSSLGFKEASRGFI
jgi:hypothetical protein